MPLSELCKPFFLTYSFFGEKMEEGFKKLYIPHLATLRQECQHIPYQRARPNRHFAIIHITNMDRLQTRSYLKTWCAFTPIVHPLPIGSFRWDPILKGRRRGEEKYKCVNRHYLWPTYSSASNSTFPGSIIGLWGYTSNFFFSPQPSRDVCNCRVIQNIYLPSKKQIELGPYRWSFDLNVWSNSYGRRIYNHWKKNTYFMKKRGFQHLSSRFVLQKDA